MDPAAVTTGLERAVLADHVRALLRATRPEVVLDVGGHVGGWGRTLRGAGYTGRIVSFEPAAAEQEELAASAAAQPPWDVRREAIGATDGEAELRVRDRPELNSLHGPSALARDLMPRSIEPSSTETVAVRRLDSIWDEVCGDAASVWLKADVQGHEPAVLAGAGDRLDAVAALQIEVSARRLYEGSTAWLELIGDLERRGFLVTAMVPSSRAPDLTVVEFDCFLLGPSAR